MKRYEPSIPRIALGLTAVAVAALNLGALIVLPAELGPPDVDPYAVLETPGMVAEPHVDEGRAMLDSRERRHALVARAITGDTRADAVQLAGARN